MCILSVYPADVVVSIIYIIVVVLHAPFTAWFVILFYIIATNDNATPPRLNTVYNMK